MKIDSIATYQFDLPLVTPLKINGTTIKTRQGILIGLTSNRGDAVFGEASPLPGLHHETIDGILTQARQVGEQITAKDLPGIRDIAGWLDQVLPANQWYPAFRFAIESALYGLFLDTPGRDNANPERRIYVNTLIMETGPDVESSLSKALSQGYRAVKLKLGRAPLDSEISMVRWVQEYIAGKATLRLDANRAWDMTSAVRFLSSVKVEQIEYIEEPLREPAELTELHSRTGVALALDESLAENDPLALQLPGGTAAFILKPAVIGSLAKCEQLIKIANAQRITVVISDTFQSGVGLSFLIDLAASLGSDTPMGFDTYRQIKTDILRERLQICNGAFSLADVIRKSRQVDMARLEKI